MGTEATNKGLGKPSTNPIWHEKNYRYEQMLMRGNRYAGVSQCNIVAKKQLEASYKCFDSGDVNRALSFLRAYISRSYEMFRAARLMRRKYRLKAKKVHRKDRNGSGC